MDALISPSLTAPSAGLLDVAGKPLILRQIQWLRAIGCERIVIELPSGALAERLTAVLDQEPLGVGVSWAPSSGAPPRVFASEQGLSERVIALPGDTLGDGDLVRIYLASDGGELQILLDAPPPFAGAPPASIWVLGPGARRRQELRGPGWGLRLQDEDDAFRLSLAVLDGSLPRTSKTGWAVQVHASKIHSGVWVAQGAQVHDTANLVRPVFIGPHAVVGHDAVVGPGVLLGANGRIGSLSRLQNSHVAPDASVPRAVELSSSRVVSSPTAPARRRPLWGLGLALLALLLVAAATLLGTS